MAQIFNNQVTNLQNQITQLQTVKARYNLLSTATQSIPSGVFTVANFNSLVWDNNGSGGTMVTTGANWLCTVPAGQDGNFIITAYVVYQGLTAGTGEVQFQLYKNAALICEGTRMGINNSVMISNAMTEINAVATDTFQALVYQSNGANRNCYGAITIRRVGS